MLTFLCHKTEMGPGYLDICHCPSPVFCSSWSSNKFFLHSGLKKILEVAGTIPEVSGGPPLSDNTHMSCSVLLNKLYDDLKGDKERENFSRLCEEYVQLSTVAVGRGGTGGERGGTVWLTLLLFLIRQHFGSSALDRKLRAIQTVSALLQGPSDVGNRCLELSGVMDAVISQCGSHNLVHQQVAVEALIHAAGKAKRASFITANGVALLKDLYKKSENDGIRVRALVVSAGPAPGPHLQEE